MRTRRSGHRCRVRALDSVGPVANATLYLNGAIGGPRGEFRYPDPLIQEGQHVAELCSQITIDDSLIRNLCNDSYADYQGDYYHVIASAFTTCRRDIMNRASNRGFSITLIPTSVGDRIALDAARTAKIQKFQEEIPNLETMERHLQELRLQNAPEDQIRPLNTRISVTRLLRSGYSRLQARRHSLLASFEQECTQSRCTRIEYDAAYAILHRYEFEVKFRVEQHRMGIIFGRQVCQSLTSLSMDPVQPAASAATPAHQSNPSTATGAD